MTERIIDRGGSFEFFTNYCEEIGNVQPELYDEIRRVIDIALQSFTSENDRKPVVLDVGAAGLLPYDTDLAERVVILDLFPKPKKISLRNNVEWIVGDILSQKVDEVLLGRMGEEGYDIVVMSSLLHHLCDKNNNALKNLETCFRNVKKILAKDGTMYIFESTCSTLVAKLEDFFYPVYNQILTKVMKFTCVRMLSVKELMECLERTGFSASILNFKEPEYIAQMYWKVPIKYYPLKISAISAKKAKTTSNNSDGN